MTTFWQKEAGVDWKAVVIGLLIFLAAIFIFGDTPRNPEDENCPITATGLATDC